MKEADITGFPHPEVSHARTPPASNREISAPRSVHSSLVSRGEAPLQNSGDGTSSGRRSRLVGEQISMLSVGQQPQLTIVLHYSYRLDGAFTPEHNQDEVREIMIEAIIGECDKIINHLFLNYIDPDPVKKRSVP
ncbi:ribosomal protein L25/Gln-tRNA synthetase [Striga asiatica]|uniref:Ribosomal protein L25/Gln-tRNA synthetase n=1 Tax=Striga asiatica TaxID=4170 RepID=A0A5A7QRF3_STRAF|nr:ribosomal protein L25/Gln-tRNA synthetase [Striga asiatica]